jgi:mono/diheme cytochrome c family protein
LRFVNADPRPKLKLKVLQHRLWPNFRGVEAMFKSWILAATGVLGATAVLAQDAAQEFAAGREEFLVACAACHGAAGDGNGEIATMFKDRVPDLTGIAKRNDGVFPLLEVIQAIDGRAVVRGHGNPMPVFGNRYRAAADNADAVMGAEVLARGRVLELALYLQSIQQ